MLILLTIILLIFIPFVMQILYLARPKFSIQGFLVILAILASWLMVLLARGDIPTTIPIVQWEPAAFFPASPTLQVDHSSWYFAIALVSLAMALIITSLAQMGHSLRAEQTPASIEVDSNDEQGTAPLATPPTQPVPMRESRHGSSWQSWAGMLVLTSFGLMAVSAGNMLTLMLAWAAADVIELVILMGQIFQSQARERIILAFTARMAGIGLVFLAGIIPWSQGSILAFETIDQSTSIYLILAASLRLGVLPLHLPLLQRLPLRRGLGTILRFVPVASSYILLVRVAQVGVLGPASPTLLGLTALAGLYGAINWLNARDELNARPFWLIGTSSLAIASAILNQPQACLAWSLASLLSGGLIFSMFLRHKNLFPLIALGLINLSALPFSPTWLGMKLYLYTDNQAAIFTPVAFYVLASCFILIHSLLLAGSLHHLVRWMAEPAMQPGEHIERWVWVIYPIGLVFILATHVLVGFLLMPPLDEVAAPMWALGGISSAIAAAIIYLSSRRRHGTELITPASQVSPLNKMFSLGWLYQGLWRVFRLMARVISLLSAVLEGEGGILWALVLFALIFVFLQR